jgi:hypothetical protein
MTKDLATMKTKGRFLSIAAPLALAAFVLGAAPAQAQDGKVGLYAGYTFFKSDDGNLSGLRLSPEYRLGGFASVVGDFSVEKGTLSSASTTLTTYLGGIRLKRGIGSVSLFAHALAGGVRQSSSVHPFGGVTISVADSGLGLDGGGGVEFKFRGQFRMRLGADYLRRKVDAGAGKTQNENDIRATVGFVF